MKAFLLIAISLLALAGVTRAVYGVDLSSSSDSFDCMSDNGMQFAIVRGYMSYGAVDYNAVGTLINARDSNLITDVYHFPCLSVDPYQQAQDLMGAMQDSYGNDLYGTVWIDVEYNPSGSCGWSDPDTSCLFLSNLVAAYQQSGKLVGIYSSQYQWESIFGDSQNCPYFTTLPIWYAHYDGDASFDDWSYSSFGGWNTPAIKQYDGDNYLCGTGVDMNFY